MTQSQQTNPHFIRKKIDKRNSGNSIDTRKAKKDNLAFQTVKNKFTSSKSKYQLFASLVFN